MMHNDLQDLYDSGSPDLGDSSSFAPNPQPLLEGQVRSDQWAAPPPIIHSQQQQQYSPEHGSPQEQREGPRGGLCSCFTVDYYHPYFDVNTVDVKTRLLESIKLWWGQPFMELIAENPEFYTPFWNAMTLLLTVAITDNFSSWTKAAAAGTDWDYDMRSLVTCSSLVFGFVSVVPFLLWIGLQQVEVPVTLPQLVCIYGYGQTPYIIAAVVCAIPSPAVAWLAMMCACVASTIFLLRALVPSVLQAEKQSAAMMTIAILAAIQATYSLLLKLLFY
jgi:hypothetical protein